MLAESVEVAGHTAAIAHDTAAANALLADWSFDALVVDVWLENESGLDWVESFVARTPVSAARIIVNCGAQMSDHDLDRVAKLGAVYLPKPFEAHTLVEMLGLPRLLDSAET